MSSGERTRRIRRSVAAALGLLLAAVGLGLLLSPLVPRQPVEAVAAPRRATRPSSGGRTHAAVAARPPAPTSVPASMRSQSHDLLVAGERVRLVASVVAGGELTVPARRGEAGVYWPSGEEGTGVAVVVGHVTWRGAPGTFHHLGRVRPGDVLSTRTGGTRQDWRVVSATLHPRGRLPTKVFSPGGEPALALVTCAGPVEGGEYTRNLLVWAEPA